MTVPAPLPLSPFLRPSAFLSVPSWVVCIIPSAPMCSACLYPRACVGMRACARVRCLYSNGDGAGQGRAVDVTDQLLKRSSLRYESRQECAPGP